MCGGSAPGSALRAGVVFEVIDISGATGPPIAGEPAFSNPADLRRYRARRAAYAEFARSHGIGEITWRCPTCGGTGHGVPQAPGASLSTSSVGEVALIALAPLGVALGVDLAPAVAPPEAEGIANSSFSPGEQAQRPAAGWRSGQAFGRIWARKEALGKMWRTGIAVSDGGAAGGPLDSSAHSTVDLGSGIPVGLVAALATAGQTPP